MRKEDKLSISNHLKKGIVQKDILTHAGSISSILAEQHALSEFEKYRVKQDKLYKSDFNLLLEEVKDNRSDKNKWK